MKLVKTFMLVFWLPFGILAQSSESKYNDSVTHHSISLNVATAVFFGGVAVMYDYKLIELKKSTIIAKAAFARAYDFGDDLNVFSLGVGQVLFNDNHHLEYDLGINFIKQDYPDPNPPEYVDLSIYTVPMINAGYRYQKPEGGFMARIGVGSTGIYLGAGVAF